MKKLHDLLFGTWQKKSIDPVVKFSDPGLYLLKARTFGLKGLIGGTHFWLVHVAQDLSQVVAEVTDLESLQIQGAQLIESLRSPADPQDKLVFISDRDGGQMWFGAKPTVIFLTNLARDEFIKMIDSYPLAQEDFKVLKTNCNTFSSWITYKLGVQPKIGIGARGSKKWTETLK